MHSPNDLSGSSTAPQPPAPGGRPPWLRLAFAFGVAALSDLLSAWAELIVPLQWGLDLATAFVLFLLLGPRWAILPGLVAEAIPGLAIFPSWVLVVLSISFLKNKNPTTPGN